MKSEFIRRRRQRLKDNFRKAREHRSVPMQVFDLFFHKLKINTFWEDYYRFGFYRKEMPWSEKVLYVGDESSYYWPWQGNSLKFDRLFIRKTLHKPILEAAGIPTSRILIKAGLDYAINTKAKFSAALAEIHQPFVTKLDGGGGGMLNMSFVPENGHYRFDDKLYNAHDIWDSYKSILRAGFLVEERVENHPVLAEMHPESLNTLRLNLIKTIDGKWHQMRPFLKIGRGGSHIDNISSGGLITALDENGVITGAFTESGERFDVHPNTNVEILGKAVPHFQDALDIAMRASETFGFMGTIGWDVGVTPDGPKIIEGNARWWAQHDQDIIGPFLTPEIAAGLVPQKWWMPWIKTHMFPEYKDFEQGGWWTQFWARHRGREAAKVLARMQQD